MVFISSKQISSSLQVGNLFEFLIDFFGNPLQTTWFSSFHDPRTGSGMEQQRNWKLIDIQARVGLVL